MKKGLRVLKSILEHIVGTAIVLLSVFSNILKHVLMLITFCIVLASIAGCIIYVKVRPDFEEARQTAYEKLSSVNEDTFKMLSDTEVYDKDNNQVGLISAGHYEYTTIDKISKFVQNGYIAVEDRRYREHIGIDYVSIARAAVALVKHNGEVTQGGSTITQQVVKNSLLSQEKTFSRKAVELMIAPYIDTRFGKDKVMEYYCNTNYYGHRCYGIQSASRFYFGKDASDLELHEAALLCRISNSPAQYDPVNHPDKAIEGRNYVLDKMLKEQYITEEECNKAKEKPLEIVQEQGEGTKENYQTSYAIHCAAIELMKEDGFEFKYLFNNKDEYDEYTKQYKEAYNDKSDAIRAGGYKIYTTLDSNIQNIAQADLDSVLSKFQDTDNETGKYLLQGASVIVDNRTNSVVAIVGGRGTDDLFNRGYLAVRQPGSTIKPLIDYAPGFESGLYSPSTIVNDHKFEGGPSNSGGSYRGNISIREGLNRSLNTVAWQVLQDIGIETGLSYLGNMEFRNISYVDNHVPAVSIGGMTNGVRVVDMAKGYSTLANEGIYNERTCIKQIDFKDGTVYTDNSKSHRVYGEDTAYMITDVLKGTMDMPYGTGHGLDIDGQQAAGKTGTTNDSKDAWFCGYTKYYTMAVWMGYDKPRDMQGVYGATYAGKIWHDTMTKLHEGLAEVDWECPDTVYEGNVGHDGKETQYHTGHTDLFSSVGKIKAEQTIKERQEEAVNNKAETAVSEYEHWFINSVEDALSVNDKFEAVTTAINAVDDSDKRSELSKRVAEHKDEIDKSVLEWSSAIKEFEANKSEMDRQQRAEEAQKAEENRKAFEKSQAILKFNTALNNLKGAKYKDREQFNQTIIEIQTYLSDCEQYEEYKELAEKFNKAIDTYEALPTREEYEESERKKAEEQQMQVAQAHVEIQNRLNEFNDNVENN